MLLPGVQLISIQRDKNSDFCDDAVSHCQSGTRKLCTEVIKKLYFFVLITCVSFSSRPASRVALRKQINTTLRK